MESKYEVRMKVCENINCNKEHDESYGSGRFCSSKCARQFSHLNDNKKDFKIAPCIVCGKEVEVNKRTSLSKVKCEQHGKILKIIKKKRK